MTMGRCTSKQKQMWLDKVKGRCEGGKKSAGPRKKCYTYNSRYFTRSLSATLLRVTINPEFLNFKLNTEKNIKTPLLRSQEQNKNNKVPSLVLKRLQKRSLIIDYDAKSIFFWLFLCFPVKLATFKPVLHVFHII